jgi:hypothetical protein
MRNVRCSLDADASGPRACARPAPGCLVRGGCFWDSLRTSVEKLIKLAREVGWNDCPPPHTAAATVPAGATDGIDLGKRRARLGRGMYQAALAKTLRENGDRTAEELQGKLSSFDLFYTNNELQDVLRNTSRYQVVELPNSGPHPAPVVGDVRLTAKGRALRGPRDGRLRTVRNATAQATSLMLKGFAGAGRLAPPAVYAVPALSIVAVWFAAHRVWVLPLVALAWWALVVSIGTFGEFQLRRAAQAWPRLRLYRPARWAFETHRWRLWVFPPVQVAVPALAVAGALLDVPVLYALGALFAVLGVLVWAVFIRPLRRGLRDEATQVAASRKEGRPTLSAPPGTTEWVADAETADGVEDEYAAEPADEVDYGSNDDFAPA